MEQQRSALNLWEAVQNVVVTGRRKKLVPYHFKSHSFTVKTPFELFKSWRPNTSVCHGWMEWKKGRLWTVSTKIGKLVRGWNESLLSRKSTKLTDISYDKNSSGKKTMVQIHWTETCGETGTQWKQMMDTLRIWTKCFILGRVVKVLLTYQVKVNIALLMTSCWLIISGVVLILAVMLWVDFIWKVKVTLVNLLILMIALWIRCWKLLTIFCWGLSGVQLHVYSSYLQILYSKRLLV